MERAVVRVRCAAVKIARQKKNVIKESLEELPWNRKPPQDTSTNNHARNQFENQLKARLKRPWFTIIVIVSASRARCSSHGDSAFFILSQLTRKWRRAF